MLSKPAREFLHFLLQLEKKANAQARRQRLIDENCVNIRRQEIRLIRFNERTPINWNDYN